MDTELEGLCFPHKYTLQHPSLFEHCLKSQTQVCFNTENKIFHDPWIGDAQFQNYVFRPYTINIHSNIQHRVLERHNWDFICQLNFVKWFISGCIGTHITVATGISAVQTQGKMRISVPKSLQRRFSISINTWKLRQSRNTSTITSQFKKQT